jgi:lysophospholipase L1-like esterase
VKNIFTIGIFVSLELIAAAGFSQKKVVALGSSTTLGAAATSGDSSWVGRLQSYFRKNTNPADPDTVVTALGGYGYTTYKELPTGYVAPIPRETIDVNNNVTAAVNLHPDIIIINLPSNDVASYTWDFVTPPYNIKETMDNFRLMFKYVNDAGIKCFITTTQPRNDLSVSQRQLQRNLVDSIFNNFGLYSINFWDDLVIPDGSNLLRDEVRHLGFPDQDFHLNNYGHSLIFQRVVAKNIFSTIGGAPLPLVLKDWQARLENDMVKLNWATVNEEPNTVFDIQRSANGRDFQTLNQKNGTSQNTDYSWTDISPLAGKNFYRLRINESARISYSRIIPIINKKNQLITSLYVDASALHVQINGLQGQTVVLGIINLSGTEVKKQTFPVTSSNNSVTIPISELAAGEYFLRITTSGGIIAVERFGKIN